MASDHTPASVAGGSVFDIFAAVAPIIAYTVIVPLKFIFVTALPWLVSTLYLSISFVLSYAVASLRLALVPVLYPFDLFLWRPFMAIVLMVYQYRHLIYFTSSALLLGAVFGLSSYWITTSVSSAKNKSAPSKANTSSPFQSSSPRLSTSPRTSRNAERDKFDAVFSGSSGGRLSGTNVTDSEEASMHQRKLPPIITVQNTSLKKSRKSKVDPSNDEDDHNVSPDYGQLAAQRQDRFQEAMQALSAKRRKTTRFAVQA